LLPARAVEFHETSCARGALRRKQQRRRVLQPPRRREMPYRRQFNARPRILRGAECRECSRGKEWIGKDKMQDLPSFLHAAAEFRIAARRRASARRRSLPFERLIPSAVTPQRQPSRLSRQRAAGADAMPYADGGRVRRTCDAPPSALLRR
jgi:hypothetical protein